MKNIIREYIEMPMGWKVSFGFLAIGVLGNLLVLILRLLGIE